MRDNMKELERFEKDLKENEEFRSRFVDYAKKESEETKLSKNEIIEKFANEHGYSFSIKEIINSKKISDEDLIKVSGGTGDEEQLKDLFQNINMNPAVAVPYEGSGPVSDIMSQIKHAGDVLYEEGKNAAYDVYSEVFDWIWNLF